MGLRGDVAKLRDIKAAIRALPKDLAEDVAKRGAEKMTALAREAYAAGRTVYGEARPVGVDGVPLDLHETGDVSGSLRFEAIGPDIRCGTLPRYARYLIGKYSILPRGPVLPGDWAQALNEIVATSKPPAGAEAK